MGGLGQESCILHRAFCIDFRTKFTKYRTVFARNRTTFPQNQTSFSCLDRSSRRRSTRNCLVDPGSIENVVNGIRFQYLA
jgi:hypothetical protein